MITSALGAITFLPALILVTKAGFIGDFERFIVSAKNRLAGSKDLLKTNQKKRRKIK
jgi:hypothetical protein